MLHVKNFYKMFFAIVVFPLWVCAQERPESKVNVLIRAYEKSRDEAAIIRILNQNSQFLRYENLGMPEGTTEKYINSPKYTTRVLQENDTTAGFVNFVKIDKTLGFLNFGSSGLVHLMGVDNDFQGKQYGKALLNHAIQELLDQGVSQISLTTKTTNQKARNLYEKSGFKLIHQLGDDCFYQANLPNEKALIPTTEEKILNYAMQHPGKALVCVAVLLLAGGYGSYKTLARISKRYNS